MKKLAIINKCPNNIIHAIFEYFKTQEIDISVYEHFSTIKSENFNLIAMINAEQEHYIKAACPIINLHQSLLPAFATENPLSEAIKYGAKVTGITIHYIEPNNFYGRIITQYPVLIGLSSHIDTISNELEEISAKLYPLVIDSVISDRVFDYTDLFKSSCNRCNKNCH